MAHAHPQFDSIARLTHLEGLATARHHVVVDLGARLRSARDDVARLRHRLADIEARADYHGKADGEIARLKERIAELEDTIARLDVRQAAASAEWNQAARTHARAHERAKELDLPLPLEILR